MRCLIILNSLALVEFIHYLQSHHSYYFYRPSFFVDQNYHLKMLLFQFNQGNSYLDIPYNFLRQGYEFFLEYHRPLFYPTSIVVCLSYLSRMVYSFLYTSKPSGKGIHQSKSKSIHLRSARSKLCNSIYLIILI